MTRKIIHCDCDCFYAAIEIRDDPALAGLPVAVGGAEDRRGVIATCNYEAREYGIHSAMASATAKRKCRDLIIIPGNMEKYRIATQQMHIIFRDYTELIEPLSLDEAFLDVSETTQCSGSGTLIAKEIRQRVRNEIGITLSAGIAPNKFLAKVASDWNKPDGQFVITPDKVADFVEKLPVRKLYGVGKVTAQKMDNFGIETCGDLQQYDKTRLLEMFGSFGETLHSLCRGIDERKVQTQSRRKSISVEHTFPEDLPSLDTCLSTLPNLMEKLEQRINNSKKKVTIGKQFVKIKFNDFISTTVEQSSSTLDLDGFRVLCRTGFERGNKPVRLLGLGVRMKEAPLYTQLEFRNF
ncbi:MAG: DNA polymerase IV [Gammaproteobacteria bacterium]|nr:DNA polymerase IV [Gammaproteobacteria bacterium]